MFLDDMDVLTPASRPAAAIGLFAGVGSFELALEPHGYHPVLFCEIEPAAQTVLRAWRPQVRLHEDVRLLDVLPRHGRLLCAGFPCTDVSQAGRKQGIFGPASGLVRDVFRLLRHKPVEWVILENVPNLLALDGGIGIAFITHELEAIGYRWAMRVVDTLAFGRPQRRRRVFLVATRRHDPREVLLADDAGPMPTIRNEDIDLDACAAGFYWTEGSRGVGLAVDSIPPLKAASTVGIPSAPAILLPDGTLGTPSIECAERCQGLPAGWTKPGEVIGRNGRWRLVGNAVTKDIPSWIAARIKTPGRYDARRDLPLAPGARWPKAAWNMGQGVHVAAVSENPLGLAPPPIAAFLTQPLRPLSARATAGFLARARQSRLRFPRDFLERIARHHARIREEEARC